MSREAGAGQGGGRGGRGPLSGRAGRPGPRRGSWRLEGKELSVVAVQGTTHSLPGWRARVPSWGHLRGSAQV